jgi:hypothetical protein
MRYCRGSANKPLAPTAHKGYFYHNGQWFFARETIRLNIAE